MAGWKNLPQELRDIILDIVVKDHEFDKSNLYLRAGYARVCREWQPVFEKENFQNVTVDQQSIFNLERFMSQKRQVYLEHLFLRIRLNEYDCTVCQVEEDQETISKNNKIFAEAVMKLLQILSKWTGFALQPGRYGRRQQGLTLELGAYSPSDTKHILRDFHLNPDDVFPKSTEDLTSHCKQRVGGLGKLNDPQHGWYSGRQSHVLQGSKLRVMGSPLEVSFPTAQFPEVKIVTTLLISRQIRRKIEVLTLSRLLCNTFKRLTEFRHEGWHDVDPIRQNSFQIDYKNLILPNLPRTLRDLHLFEEFNKVLHPERVANRGPSDMSLGKVLSNSSRCLENLSAAFLVDAEDFFNDFWPTKSLSGTIPWKNLRTLALTSRLLEPNNVSGLLAAGRAAAFMPQLEILEIWNESQKHTGHFLYLYDTATALDLKSIRVSTFPYLYDPCQCRMQFPSKRLAPGSRKCLDPSRRPALISNYPVSDAVVQCWADLPQHDSLGDRRGLMVWTPFGNECRTKKLTHVFYGKLWKLRLRTKILNRRSLNQQLFEERYEHEYAQNQSLN